MRQVSFLGIKLSFNQMQLMVNNFVFVKTKCLTYENTVTHAIPASWTDWYSLLQQIL